jgi:hypothetical protein
MNNVRLRCIAETVPTQKRPLILSALAVVEFMQTLAFGARQLSRASPYAIRWRLPIALWSLTFKGEFHGIAAQPNPG